MNIQHYNSSSTSKYSNAYSCLHPIPQSFRIAINSKTRTRALIFDSVHAIFPQTQLSLRQNRPESQRENENETNDESKVPSEGKFVISTCRSVYTEISEIWYIRRAVVHIQLQPVSPGIWHVVSQRSQPDSPSDSWRITVIACLWSLTSSWSHNYRMASRSINERHRRCCTRRAPFYAPVRVRTCAYLYRAGYIRTSRALLSVRAFLSFCSRSTRPVIFRSLDERTYIGTIGTNNYIFFVVLEVSATTDKQFAEMILQSCDY